MLARAALLLPVDDPAAVAVGDRGDQRVGSLLLGVVVGWLDDRHPRARAFLGTGVLGGFTTYSAFAVQTVVASATELWLARGPGRGIRRRRASSARSSGCSSDAASPTCPGEIEPPESAE